MRSPAISLLSLLAIGCLSLLAVEAQSQDNVTCPKAADIIVILDQSTSVVAGQPNYDNWDVRMLGFFKAIVLAFPIDLNKTLVGGVKFSNEAHKEFYLNEFTDIDSLLRRIGQIKIGGGDTNIAGALGKTNDEMLIRSNGARPGVPKIVILITDGIANRREDETVKEANRLKGPPHNAELYAVGINEADPEQLAAIASEPPDEHVFYVSDFQSLNSVLQSLVDNSCKKAATLPTTTTTTTTTTPQTTTKVTTTKATTTKSTPTTTTTTTPTTTTTTTPTTTTTTTPTTTTTTTPTTTTTTTPTTTKTTTTDRSGMETGGPCRKQADVAFVIDTTSNMDYNYFQTFMLGYVQDVVRQLDVDNGRTRVAVASFSNDARVDFCFTNYTRTVDVVSAVSKVVYGGYRARLDSALSLLRSSVFVADCGTRLTDAAVTKLAVIVTDNPSVNKTATQAEAQRLRDAGVGLVTVGVGTYLDRYELSAVASYPYRQNMFTVNTVRNLSALVEPVKRIVCGDDGVCSGSICQSGAQCSEVMNRINCRCPPGRTGERCTDTCANGADVVIALDASGSIGLDNFQLMTTFVGQLIQTLDVDSSQSGPTISRVGLVTFSDSAVLQFQLGQYRSQAALLQAVNVPYLTGSTNTAAVIRYVQDVMFQTANGDRAGVPNYLIIMTDGNSDNATATWNEARSARARGINIITVGIGDQINSAELKSIASAPSTSNVLLVTNFTTLVDTARLQIARLLCNNENRCNLSPSPCRNGATCRNIMGSYTCGPCPSGFTGYNCERRCSGEIDLAFLLDSAGTVHAERWPYVLDFVEWIVNRLDVGYNRTRVAVVYWSGSAHVGFTLDKYFVRQDVIQAVRMLPYLGGRTNTTAALERLGTTVFQPANGDRNTARNVAVLVANGQSTIDADKVAATARDLRAAGAVLITVAAERLMDRSAEMLAIASEPRSRHMFVTPTLSTVMNASDSVLNALCDDVDECQARPCQNGGTCVNEYGRYFCRCQRNFAGYNCERSCRQRLDVIFVLDISGSIQEKYDNAMQFAANVTYGLDVDSDTARVAAVAYSTLVVGEFYLGEFVRRREAAVTALRFHNSGGSTNTAAALDAVRTRHITASRGARSGVTKVVVLVTDGYSNVNTGRTVAAAADLKTSGVLVYSVANGAGAQLSELTAIASSPASQFVYQLHGDVAATARQLLDQLCSS